jgi:hypothetical protein
MLSRVGSARETACTRETVSSARAQILSFLGKSLQVRDGHWVSWAAQGSDVSGFQAAVWTDRQRQTAAAGPEVRRKKCLAKRKHSGTWRNVVSVLR